MRISQRFIPASLALALIMVPVAAMPVVATAARAQDQQDRTGAVERGYRTGYSDGYQAGWRDSVERAARDYRNKEDYLSADRAYVPAYGDREDYRDGYQQGFEVGYEAGYDRRGFDSTIPAGLTRRGTAPAASATNDDTGVGGEPGTAPAAERGAVLIPADTVMRVELKNNLSTDASQRGDTFEALVLDAGEFQDATVSGRVTRVRRPGKTRGRAELQLSFEQISLKDGRFANFNAQVIDVVQAGDDSPTGDVDPEGGVRGRDSTKDDVAKVGAGAGLGAIIGAIAGGGKGAAIGAVIGGAAGTGGVLATRGKEIRLERGQQLLIRTSTQTRIQ